MNSNSKNVGNWVDKLLDSLDCYATLETSDGIERSGRISGFEMRIMKFNKKPIEVPIQIELNGDPNDKIPLDRIVSLEVG